ncbi:hypothetical protein G9A89_015139 [Geosiphon pyriformis]|nr:hypothetical protein G9A89_015139 [Geosiphon pyriformis]
MDTSSNKTLVYSHQGCRVGNITQYVPVRQSRGKSVLLIADVQKFFPEARTINKDGKGIPARLSPDGRSYVLPEQYVLEPEDEEKIFEVVTSSAAGALQLTEIESCLHDCFEDLYEKIIGAVDVKVSHWGVQHNIHERESDNGEEQMNNNSNDSLNDTSVVESTSLAIPISGIENSFLEIDSMLLTRPQLPEENQLSFITNDVEEATQSIQPSGVNQYTQNDSITPLEASRLTESTPRQYESSLPLNINRGGNSSGENQDLPPSYHQSISLNIGRLTTLLRNFDRHIKEEALSNTWTHNRQEWHERNPSTIQEFAKQMVEYECALPWSSLNALWVEERPLWLILAKNAQSERHLAAALLQLGQHIVGYREGWQEIRRAWENELLEMLLRGSTYV